MPSSGARSGTRPSRAGRGGGRGDVGATPLACSHETHLGPVARGQGSLRLYLCPQGCGLVRRKAT